jgi:hypothetical protein
VDVRDVGVSEIHTTSNFEVEFYSDSGASTSEMSVTSHTLTTRNYSERDSLKT